MSEPVDVAMRSRVPGIYFNGFELGLSNSDVLGVLQLGNAPVCNIHMSYTTAKSLAEALTEIVGHLEKVTERSIMTTKEVTKGLERLSTLGSSQ